MVELLPAKTDMPYTEKPIIIAFPLLVEHNIVDIPSHMCYNTGRRALR